MQTSRHALFLVLTISLLTASPPAVAQVVSATLPAGVSPIDIALNSATNKIYVSNECGNDVMCNSPGTVTIIDGATNNTATVTVGDFPFGAAVNSVSNKIYVVNNCGNDITCNSLGTVTVIDGATNNTATVTVGYFPYALAVNSVTNKIYVANFCGSDVTCNSPGTATVIDGATNNTSTVTVGDDPLAVAVNSVTNKIYVANYCGNDITCNSVGTATVIDGVSNNTSTVNVGFSPFYLDLNSATDKIYVSNNCGNDVTCGSHGTVTVIDGASNNTATVAAGNFPNGVAVNSVTNKIYVANQCGNDLTCNSPGTVTVVDGASNNTTTVDVGFSPYFVGIDSVTNKIYVPNYCGNDLMCNSPGTVTVINGATNSTVPVAVGDSPDGVAVNSSANTIYVPNVGDGTVSVIAGDTALQFVAMPPCRLADTRAQNGGGGAIQGGTSQTFNLPQLAQAKGCASLATAATYSLNVTLVPQNGAPVGYLTIWPAGEVNRPLVSTMNSLDGRIKANAAVVPAGVSGGVNVYVSNTTDVVLDIDGYFALTSGSTLAFYPLTPCRIADTRKANGDLGGPSLTGKQERDFPVLESSCIPSGVNPSAYSLNFTAVPLQLGQPLGYLTVWPTGQSQPLVSTLNNLTGTIVANAAIVPAGTNGEISVYPDTNTNLVIDINGYFAAAGQSGLSLYPAVPCRVIDTRTIGNGQPFSGLLSPPVDVVDSVCSPPSTAQAYVFNTTVVPFGGLGYLTLWPDGESRPVVSTLNAIDGAITSNMAIVPNKNGNTDAYASGITQLILDISSYFAP